MEEDQFCLALFKTQYMSGVEVSYVQGSHSIKENVRELGTYVGETLGMLGSDINVC
jgi:hypothetical protein